MVLVLKRQYFPEGVNGTLEINGKLFCNTIELPWKENQKRVSCIPEGKYPLRKRYSRKFGRHIELVNVKNRSLILIHPANNALLELNGCISPVTKISGAGTGLMSRNAFNKLKNLVYQALEKQIKVTLIIKS